MVRTLSLVLLLLAACDAGPRISGSDSPQAFATSLEKVRSALPDAQRQEFDQGLIALAFNTSDPASMALFQSAGPSPMLALGVRDQVKGRTGPEIIRLSYEARIRKLDEEIGAVATELRQAQAERERHKAVFDNIVVTGARYYVDTSFIRQPVIEFTLANNTNFPLRRAYFHGTVASPGRAVPWVSEDFNYELEGGLEPGESRLLRLSPYLSDWDGEWASRRDLQLKVAVQNVENANGEKVLAGEPPDPLRQQAEVAAKQKMKADLKARLDALG